MKSYEDLEREYAVMAQAYTNIFNRCGLETKAVQSDSGAIGGSVSHEYMVLTDTAVGENDVFYCESCDYSANSNHAISILPINETDGGFKEEKIVDTPNVKTIEDLAKFFNIETNCILKAVAYIYDSKPAIAMIRGDKEIEETNSKIEDLEKYIKNIENDTPIDIIELDLKECWSSLGEIIGETYTDELIDEIIEDSYEFKSSVILI